MPLTFYEVTLDRGIPFAKAQAIQAEWLEKLKALRTEEQRTKEAEQLQEQRRKQREKEERRKLIYAQRKRERDEERAKKRKAAAAKRAQASGKGKGRKVVVEEEEESSSEEELELEIVGDEDEDEEEDAEEEAAKEVWVSPLGLCLDWVPLLIAHMCSIETFVVTSTRLISLFRSKPNQPKAAKKAAEEKAKKDKEEYNDGAGTGFYRCVLVFALRACGRLTDVIVAWRHSTARRPVHARLKPVIPRPSPPLPRRHPPPPPRRKDSPEHIVLALHLKESAFKKGATVGSVGYRMEARYRLVSSNTGYRVRCIRQKICCIWTPGRQYSLTALSSLLLGTLALAGVDRLAGLVSSSGGVQSSLSRF